MPFFDHLGDSIVIYIDKTDGDVIKLTDDGIILNNLDMSDFSLSGKIKKQIESICRDNGLILEGKEISVASSEKEIGNKAYLLAQALLKIDSLYVSENGCK